MKGFIEVTTEEGPYTIAVQSIACITVYSEKTHIMLLVTKHTGGPYVIVVEEGYEAVNTLIYNAAFA